MTQDQINKLKYRALLIIFVLILVIAGSRLYDDIKAHNQIVKKEQIMLSKQIKYNYNYELSKLKSILLNRALHIASANNVLEAFENKEREKLYSI